MDGRTYPLTQFFGSPDIGQTASAQSKIMLVSPTVGVINLVRFVDGDSSSIASERDSLSKIGTSFSKTGYGKNYKSKLNFSR